MSHLGRRITNLCFAFVLAVMSVNLSGVLSLQSAFADTPGNNGTLKVHELGTPENTESNDPKVCAFNFEGFQFDAGQSGNIIISTQPGDDQVLTVPYSSSQATPPSQSPYINDGTTHGYTLAEGHYKATLYGKDSHGRTNTNDEKAKSKVFKVLCVDAPTFVDQCGTIHDKIILPKTTGNAYFKVSGDNTNYKNGPTLNGSGTVTVTYYQKVQGSIIAFNTWDFTFSTEPCDHPADQVTYGNWIDGTYKCSDTSVIQTRTVTTTPYKWNGTTWIPDTTKSVTTTETKTRVPTSDELKACTTQPADKVVYSDWTNGIYKCADTNVLQTRTKTVTTYIWNGTAWVLDTAHAVTTTETQYRQPTSDELKACHPQPKDDVKYSDWVDSTYKCNDLTVTQTQTVTTTPYTWNGTAWVLDTAHATMTTNTKTRLPTSDELMHCSTQPDDEVTYGNWTNGTYKCGDETVTQTRTKTVTPYVWNGTAWVPDTAHTVTTTETKTRQPTSNELKSCSPQPADNIAYSDWTDGAFTCGDTTVEQTRTKTVTPYMWNGTEWVLDDTNAVTTTETQPRDLTADDLSDCPVDTCQPGTVTLEQLSELQNNSDCTPGQGGAGGETPSTPITPATPAKPAAVVTELPQTGPDAGDAFAKVILIVAAGISTYGAVFFAVNRRELLKK